MNTELTGADLKLLENQLRETEEKLQELEEECADLNGKQYFCLSSICHDDNIVRFYIGLGTSSALMLCFNFLGQAVNRLNYWMSTSIEANKSNKDKKRTLSPLEVFFLVLVHLHL